MGSASVSTPCRTHEGLEVWRETPRTRVSWDEAMEFALFRETSWASGSHCRPKSQPSEAGSQASPSELTFRLHFQAIPVMPDGGQITPVTPAMPTTEHRPRRTGAIHCAHLRAAMRIPPTRGRPTSPWFNHRPRDRPAMHRRSIERHRMNPALPCDPGSNASPRGPCHPATKPASSGAVE